MSSERKLSNNNMYVKNEKEDSKLIFQEVEVKTRPTKKTLRINILPLITAIVIILLFVTSYLVYNLLTKRNYASNINDETNMQKPYSKFSYPGCGVRLCEGSTCSPRYRRIVGGNHAHQNNWPWVVDIVINNVHTCAGTLLNKRYVLTAAHCLFSNGNLMKASKMKINLGLFNRVLPESSRQSYEVCNFFVHEKYDAYTMVHDIALIKLRTVITLNKYVWPACIPAYDRFDVDGKGYLLGWGKEAASRPFSSILKEAYVPVVSYNICSQKNDQIYRELKVNKNFHLCVGYGSASEEYACYGDSGGGFMIQTKKYWQVQGIISWIDPTCNSTASQTYTVLTNVAFYEKWLGENMDLSFLES